MMINVDELKKVYMTSREIAKIYEYLEACDEVGAVGKYRGMIIYEKKDE